MEYKCEETIVCLKLSEYRALLLKANAIDIIAEDICRNIDNDVAPYAIVDDDLVRIMTGTIDYKKE